jgi:hypothetical protein
MRVEASALRAVAWPLGLAAYDPILAQIFLPVAILVNKFRAKRASYWCDRLDFWDAVEQVYEEEGRD